MQYTIWNFSLAKLHLPNQIFYPTQKKISDNLQRLNKQGYQHILLQPFLEEFNKFGEIKVTKGGGPTPNFKLPDDVLPN